VTVVALEGLPFSGKSTSISVMSRLDKTIVTVPEYHDLADATFAQNVGEAPATAQDQLRRVAYYQQLDETRWQEVERAPRHSLVLMDRCHVSVMAFARALDAQNNFGVFGEIASDYKRRVGSSECALSVPDRILFLEMSPEIAEERIPRLATSMSHDLTNPRFIRSLIRSYTDLLGRIEAEVILVDSNGSLEETVEGVQYRLYEE
jgi:thymidylate kinase